ncbi:MAG: DUF1150 domain-containing protein [Pseudonocardiales bacterium]|nr:DUF1150 domain-containing protein [Hyphomicrobiales bacterium]MBV8825510.1 DUF1150 domain-containing protein [Hyphomicrobiales bacterium]MBV9429436.1 DUF1150 domain-containing protein [Bradyrhizobiaceae bacterium]MBV9728104.1 DUF1150 domain-containing protein [Pseudonocardiales bacterium]
MSAQAFAELGTSRIAYIKAIRSEDVSRHYPNAPEVPAHAVLFALHAADGTPMLLAGTREAAVVGAQGHELEALSVH